MGEEKIVTGNAKVGEKPQMCPTCGANDIMYNPQINRFVCKYCRTEFEIATEKLEGFVNDLAELEGTVIGEGAQNIDINASLNFYLSLGFHIVYERKETRFAFIELEGNQLMLEEINSLSYCQIIQSL